MNLATSSAERLLLQALEAAEQGDDALFDAIDQLPAATYVTDRDGVITYFNSACIGFAGRTPVRGQDRWCVTWKLYTDDGDFLPHDQCPMAVAIQEQRAVRGVTAMAERPDGTRVNFQPFPTPLLDEQGKLRGAVNMLVDITDSKQAAVLREQATRCLRLAGAVDDPATTATLRLMAREFEDKAAALDRPGLH